MSEAQALKNKGNQFLAANQFEAAVEAYTAAIALDATSAVFFANRAQAHIRLENYGLAIEDATAAIACDAGYTKGWYRRAVAHAAIVQYKECKRDLKVVLQRTPNDMAAKALEKEASRILRAKKFEQAILGEEEAGAIELMDLNAMVMESSYDGMDLPIQVPQAKGEPVIVHMTPAYITAMIERFKAGKQLPKRHAYAIVAATNELLKSESSLVDIALAGPRTKLSICGDTHGQFYDVLNIFERFGAPSTSHAYLFNGDFVDRGSWSCEVAFLLYCYKLLYPTQIFLNRGNHETDDMNEAYGFKDECKAKYSEKLFRMFSESFNSLPYACLVGGDYLVMHGGLFSRDNITLDDIRNINRFRYKQPPKEGIEMELLWTDPQKPNGRAPSKRGIGMQFGPDVTERFCLSNKLKGVIRSHEVRMGGYEVEHNGRLITVFSAPNYCDSQGNLGCVIGVEQGDEGVELAFETFAAVQHPAMGPMAYSNRG